MNAHIFQHVPFEGPGSILSWLERKHAQVRYTHWYDHKPNLPDLSTTDLLIVMGGPMSVHDEAQYPWLIQEKQYLREAIDKEIAMVGICLGAQLIAHAFGAKVYRHTHPEIGWFPVEGIDHDQDVFTLPKSINLFHWHGETFDLPQASTWLAQSAACKHQAFQIKHNILALQCHLETTEESLKSLCQNCGQDIAEGIFVQSVQRMLRTPSENFSKANALMDQVLDYLTQARL